MTARASTEVEAANIALVSFLGERPITSLSDNNARARVVRVAFGAARDEVLQGHNWNFATGYIVPAARVAPAAGWPGPFTKRYALPEDCIKLRSIEFAEADEWSVLSVAADAAGTAAEVKVLATSLTAPSCCYTRRVENVQLWSPQFLTAFAHKLAEMCAPSLARSTSKADSEAAKSQAAIDIASQNDSKEKARSQVSRRTSWLGARRRGGARWGSP